MVNPANQPIIVIDTPIMLFDGGARGTPRQGAAAAILLMPNGRRYTVSQLISLATEDEAKYTGLIIGLEKARKLGIRALEIKGDSEAIFNQVNGLVKVEDAKLQRLYQEVLRLIKSFDKVSLEWIPQEFNRSAKAAVNRCIGEALGRERTDDKTTTAATTSDAVRHLVQLGSSATDQDYRQLKASLDQWTDKSLIELRALVLLEVQDAIALQWHGDEENLAQMYRWYLRGLPPAMASYKVNLDYSSKSSESEKLPWEEALISPTEDPFASLNASSEETIARSVPSSEPSNPFAASETTQEDPFTLSYTDNFSEINYRETLISPPHLDFGETEEVTDTSKDTLPSEMRVSHVVNTIADLSSAEKMALVRELVKFPELVNLMLKAIADNVSGGALED